MMESDPLSPIDKTHGVNVTFDMAAADKQHWGPRDLVIEVAKKYRHLVAVNRQA